MADRRIIAIAVTPKAYDEIQRLKGNRTWTQYVLEGMVILHPKNQILEDEYKASQKEPKTPKPKAEKKKKAAEVTGEREPTEAAVETEVPSAEEAERVEVEGKGTLIMPHTHKSKKSKTKKSEEV